MHPRLQFANRSLPGRLARVVLLGCVELAVYFPLLLVLHWQLSPLPLWGTCLQLAACYGIGGIGGETGWLKRNVWALLFAALGGFAVFVPPGGPAAAGGWVLGAIGAWLVMRGIRLVRTPWSWRFPPMAFMFGFVAYFIAVPLMARIDTVQAYVPMTNALGFVSLVIFLFDLNRLRLLEATLSGDDEAQQAVTGTIRRHNRLWLSGAVGLVALIGFLPQLQAVALATLRAVAAALNRLLHREPPAAEPSAPPDATPAPMPLLGGEPHQPSLLTEALNLLLLIAGYTAVVVLALLALYLLIRRGFPALRGILQRLLGRFGVDDALDATGYVDEKETLLAWRELPKLWRKRLQARFSARAGAPDWSALPTRAARSRYLYALALAYAAGKGYRVNPALTPQETQRELDAAGLLPPQAGETLTALYNEARYSGKEPSEAQLREALEKAQPILPKQVR
ncbi:DUF4129 domain-containing protein [Paenibacillus athensensis]|uniref:Protein-glutamine gamma-glutamyltransferase-like C-terminal domain-containing protein n=1 Tax=Paenibacillus athensensis TaxID=1967502 RepID=A0A4Y8PZ18_9BACL|nr:DUF4129 domain-containing protein [Paenibacillus athensensis]MCD1261450.1 DUF4129 domain-containing protein [Paenibacillus athensensis]